MKILIYGLNFAPELTGIGKYTGEMVAWLAAQGHEVRVVTAPPYYPDWRVGGAFSATKYQSHTVRGNQGQAFTVWRCPLWVPFRPGGAKRLLHLASFALTSLPVLLRQVFWRPQVVWVVAPAFFCAPGAWLTARLCGARCWLHIQDFEVDAAFALGLLEGQRLRRVALGLERWLLRRFDRVSSISMRMLEHLHAKGVAAERVVPFPNWVDLAAIAPAQVAAEQVSGEVTQLQGGGFRSELGIAVDAVVALYSGNMGKKQGLEILAQAALLTRLRTDVVWVFCGDGAGRGELEAACAGLANVRLMPLQPLERLGDLLRMADIHLLPQRADAADLVMPSKLTGMLASGRPVVATARRGTELERVVAQCGVVVDAEDPEAFGFAVLAVADAVERRAEMGLAARAYAEAHLDRDAVLRAFESELLLLIGEADVSARTKSHG
jgi:colanic acid biosynthesis glycosyl transferase WcaI